MRSGPDLISQLRVSFHITAWFFVLFVVTSVSLYFLTSHLVQEALEDDWFERCTEIQRQEAGGSAVLDPIDVEAMRIPPSEIQATVAKEFRRFFPVVMLPIILLGLAGGLFLTSRAVYGLRSVLITVREILTSGRVQRRVDLEGLRYPIRDLGVLFNEALARNEALIQGLHQSLDNVAHDLRTPMTRLRAVAENALQAPHDTDTCAAAISDCLEESEAVLAMLNTLMDVAEAETGAMRLDREDLDVEAQVESVRDLYEIVAEERSIRIQTDIEDGLRVPADKVRLRRVLANLVDNAIKYGPDDSTIRIEARTEEDDVVFRVRDEGPGIPDADLPKIWDRLYRGDSSRSKRGLGLGLNFVRAIVEAHGGTVEVRTTVGEGSTFSVRIPRSDSGAE